MTFETDFDMDYNMDFEVHIAKTKDIKVIGISPDFPTDIRLMKSLHPIVRQQVNRFLEDYLYDYPDQQLKDKNTVLSVPAGSDFHELLKSVYEPEKITKNSISDDENWEGESPEYNYGYFRSITYPDWFEVARWKKQP